jgi:hypothetical protein
MMVLPGVLLMVLKIALQDGFDAYRLLPPSLLLSEKRYHVPTFHISGLRVGPVLHKSGKNLANPQATCNF